MGNVPDKRNRVIIFGSSGFIGGNLCTYLVKKDDFEVIGFSSKECNLLEKQDVLEVMKNSDSRTSIVLCSNISRFIDESWRSMLNNITMTHNLLVGITNRGLRSIVFLSSSDIYGLPPKNLPITEDTLPDPSGYYGLSKLISETLLLLETQNVCPVTILRMPGIYGRGDNNQSLIGKFVEKALNNEEIILDNGGNTKRDYVEVDDLCRIVEHFLKKSHRGIVNVATGRETTIGKLVEVIVQILKKKPSIKFKSQSDKRGADLFFDITKLKSLCPEIAMTDLIKGIRKYINENETCKQ